MYKIKLGQLQNLLCERERVGETDRQTDRQTERQREGESERDRKTERGGRE